MNDLRIGSPRQNPGRFFVRCRSRPALLLLGTLVAAASVNVGCDRNGVDFAGPQKSVSASFAGISEPETIAIRERLEKSVREDAAEIIAPDFDVEAFARLVCESQASAGANFQEAVQAELEGGQVRVVASQIKAVVAETALGGEYSFVRTGDRDGRTTAIYRLVRVDGGFHYQEWAFLRGDDAVVRIGDVYNFGAGEWLSETIGRIAAAGTLMKSPEQAELFEQRFHLARRLVEVRNSPELDRVVAKFPPEIREDKFVILMQIMAAENDEEAYRRHYLRLAAKFPDDTATALLNWTMSTSDGEYQDAIAALDDLDRHVGGDPMLAAFRGDQWTLMDRPEEAKAAYLASIQGDPSLREPYLGLMYLDAIREDFASAVDWARKYGEARNTSPTMVGDLDAEGLDEVWRSLGRSKEWQALQEEPDALPSSPSS